MLVLILPFVLVLFLLYYYALPSVALADLFGFLARAQAALDEAEAHGAQVVVFVRVLDLVLVLIRVYTPVIVMVYVNIRVVCIVVF